MMKDNAHKEESYFEIILQEHIDAAMAMYAAGKLTNDMNMMIRGMRQMTEYKVITDAKDKRLKEFEKATEKSVFFRRDPRKLANYSRKFVYGDYSNSVEFDVATTEHVGKRIEGNYEGDTNVASRDIRVEVTEIISSPSIKAAVNSIDKLLAKDGKKSPANLHSSIMSGERAIFEVRTRDVLAKQHFGYVLLTRKGLSGLALTYLVDRDSLNEVHIKAKRLEGAVKSNMTTMLEGMNVDMVVTFRAV